MAALQLFHGGGVYIGAESQGLRYRAGPQCSVYVPHQAQCAALTLPQLSGAVCPSDAAPGESSRAALVPHKVLLPV